MSVDVPRPTTKNRSEHVALLEGVEFPYAPESVNFGFRSKIKTDYTLGGKVIQVFGSTIDDLTLVSRFRDDQEQHDWHEYLKALATNQVTSTRSQARVYNFSFAHRDWSFDVHIKSFTQTSGGGGSTGIHVTPGVLAPQFRLVLALVDQPEELTDIASDRFLSSLAQNFGWQQSEYNGYATLADVEAFLQGLSVQEYLGLSNTPGQSGTIQDTIGPDGLAPSVIRSVDQVGEDLLDDLTGDP